MMLDNRCDIRLNQHNDGTKHTQFREYDHPKSRSR